MADRVEYVALFPRPSWLPLVPRSGSPATAGELLGCEDMVPRLVPRVALFSCVGLSLTGKGGASGGGVYGTVFSLYGSLFPLPVLSFDPKSFAVQRSNQTASAGSRLKPTQPRLYSPRLSALLDRSLTSADGSTQPQRS